MHSGRPRPGPPAPPAPAAARKFSADAAAAVERLFLETCRATAAKLPLHLLDEEMSWAGALLYLLTGRACAVAAQEGRVQLPRAAAQQGPAG